MGKIMYRIIKAGGVKPFYYWVSWNPENRAQSKYIIDKEWKTEKGARNDVLRTYPNAQEEKS